MENNQNIKHQPRPEWLKIKTPGGSGFAEVTKTLRTKSLHTVCEEAHCPNVAECWNLRTATFMILGDTCVRDCRYCAIKTGVPLPPDPEEPRHVAESVKSMNLKHAVITSVTRDDLHDSGAEFWAEVIREIRKINPEVSIEVLVPDFRGKDEFMNVVFAEKPDIFNHNIETIEELFPVARPQAIYKRSLYVLKKAKEYGLRTKTGFMVGLGETHEQIIKLMKDVKESGVDILTIGQYLQPTHKHLPVAKYLTPEEFAELKKIGLDMGFEFVESAPLVRSSYHAAEQIKR